MILPSLVIDSHTTAVCSISQKGMYLCISTLILEMGYCGYMHRAIPVCQPIVVSVERVI